VVGKDPVELEKYLEKKFALPEAGTGCPSSGLSRGHPVDQVKMFKKKLLTLKKISKLPIFVQKYLINILALLYFPFEQKLEK
jgi:hypothetical protein